MKKQTAILLIVLICQLPVQTLTLAQIVHENEGFFHLSLTELMNIEVEVATKFKTQVTLTPSSVTVFSRKEIQNLGITRLEHLLNYVPGFDATRDVFTGQGHTITPRGRTSNQNSRDVLILIDGQRVNEDSTGGATQGTRYISLHNVKQVEIIRGPGSALYGSNAFLGVVNVVTDKHLNDVNMSINEYKDNELSFNWSKNSNEFHHSLSMLTSHESGIEYQTEAPNEDSTTQDPISRQQLSYSLESKQWDLSIRYIRNQLNDFYLFGFIRNGINDYQTENSMANFRYHWLNDGTTKINQNLSYSHQLNEALIQVAPASFMINLGNLTTGETPFFAGFISETREIATELSIYHQFSNNHNVSLGVELREAELVQQKNKNNYELTDFIDSILLGGGGSIEYYGDIRETSDSADIGSRTISSAYFQDEYHWHKNVISTLGLRFDNYSDFGSSTNPRLAFLYQSDNQWQVRYMYGEAFRAPSPIERTVKNSPAEVGNPNLKAEEINTNEISFGYSQNKFQLKVTAFENHIKNEIIQTPIENGRITYSNSGDSTYRGWEFEYRQELTPYFQIAANFTQYDQLNQMTTPEELASIITNFQYENININVNSLYRGKRIQAAGGPVPLDEYLIHNTHFRYRLDSQTEVSLTIDNIGDKAFETIAHSTDMPNGVPNKGRLIKFNIGWRGL